MFELIVKFAFCYVIDVKGRCMYVLSQPPVTMIEVYLCYQICFFFQTTPAWYDTVLLQSGSAVWIENFRFPEAAVNNLCDLLKDDMAPSDITVRDPVPLKKRYE